MNEIIKLILFFIGSLIFLIISSYAISRIFVFLHYIYLKIRGAKK